MENVELTRLRIEVHRAPESSDFEVRLLAESGDNLIHQFEKGLIGLDPADILRSPSPLEASEQPREVTIGRCHCGEIGCDSVAVFITREGSRVTWRSLHGPTQLQFDAAAYDREVARAVSDLSWETPDRTTGRLIATTVDRQALAAHGLTFQWTSKQWSGDGMTISLCSKPDPYQILVHISPMLTPPERMARHCVELLRQHPNTWERVEWSPQKADLGAPAIAGRGWSRFR